MPISELSGKAQTVLGVITPEDLGITLPHEHLIGDQLVPGIYYEMQDGKVIRSSSDLRPLGTRACGASR